MAIIYERTLQTTQRNMLRRMLRHKWPPRKSENSLNDYVDFFRETAGEIDDLILKGLLLDWVNQYQKVHANWRLRVESHTDQHWSQKILSWDPNFDGTKIDSRAYRGRGRPCKRWV
eukprot:gnl/MRDRNA2_/MRDRNA2_80773_c0_seq2.p1 gnl/MRDRNA2_/MRDRNA2_80773_c0~~gnl/MRDRNA2_/MRDRNA2_80773_c0_seq2.p1  ORF type:complete len:116 (-),score=1.12 gnl/MRDRNA2_/MRDRNA2_80773_c0_seq2:1-348(-)